MVTLGVESVLDVPWSLLLQGLGPLTIVGVVLVFLLRLLAIGQLRTGREIEELRQDRDERVKAAEDIAQTWKEAYFSEQQARRMDAEVRDGVLEMGKLTVELIDDIRKQNASLSDKDGE